jgi:DNA polymerase-3 subunit alpha
MEAMSKIPALVDKAIADGMDALAITDLGNMHGIKEFYNYVRTKNAGEANQQKHLKPIIGCEIYMTQESCSCIRTGRLILLAKNKTGYLHLIQLVSLGFTEGFRHKPYIDRSLIDRYKEGLIVIAPDKQSVIAEQFKYGDMQAADESMMWFHERFGDDFYLGIQHPLSPSVELAKKYGFKYVAVSNVHYVDQDEAEAHHRQLCIRNDRFLFTKNNGQEWLKTQKEMAAAFSDMPEVLHTSNEIAGKVAFYDIDHCPVFPKVPIASDFEDANACLRHLCGEGAKKRYVKIDHAVQKRIDFELNIIIEKGWAEYFLFMHDIVSAARKMGIRVGAGRGSAPGSIVNYCLHITDIDPLRFGLLFERFLNPRRTVGPDIDIDIDDVGRKQLLHYLISNYGRKRVAHIATFDCWNIKSAMKLPLDEQTIIKYAKMLEGTVSEKGVHPCGVVVGRDDITNYAPVSTAFDDENDSELLVTQYAASVIEETGLVKFDFLPLRTLSVIRDTLALIRHRGETLDMDMLPTDDEFTLKLYQTAATTEIFQFESNGMCQFLRQLKPTKFEELVALNALYRPGAMDYIPEYIARKHGRKPIEYDIPLMEKHLKETYGLIIYQEQIMSLSQDLAGFTPWQSDDFRRDWHRARYKKDVAMQVKIKDCFMDGCLKNGHDRMVAEKVWMEMEKMFPHAFNKSHAVAYTWVSYQTAYLKAHYRKEYMAAQK